MINSWFLINKFIFFHPPGNRMLLLFLSKRHQKDNTTNIVFFRPIRFQIFCTLVIIEGIVIMNYSHTTVTIFIDSTLVCGTHLDIPNYVTQIFLLKLILPFFRVTKHFVKCRFKSVIVERSSIFQNATRNSRWLEIFKSMHIFLYWLRKGFFFFFFFFFDNCRGVFRNFLNICD